jgi:acetylglutamate kinase
VKALFELAKVQIQHHFIDESREMNINNHDLVAKALIEALPALLKLKDKLIVIKYGGSAMENERLIEAVLCNITLLAAVGIHPILVHGGGKAINKAMRDANLQPTFIQGMRYTDAATIEIVERTFNQVITPKIVASLQKLGAQAIPIPGTEILRAKKLLLMPLPSKSKKIDSAQATEPIDLGFVGEITEIKTLPIQAVIRQGKIPVISPIATDRQGQRYNINADVAAAAIAQALKAHTLIFLSDVNGVLRNPTDVTSRIPVLTEKQITELRKQNVIDGGMIPKLESALIAMHGGVQNVHLLDGRAPHALLLKLFTHADLGTDVHI